MRNALFRVGVFVLQDERSNALAFERTANRSCRRIGSIDDGKKDAFDAKRRVVNIVLFPSCNRSMN